MQRKQRLIFDKMLPHLKARRLREEHLFKKALANKRMTFALMPK